uniref:Uncharacterized protein n=1 Tax=Arundo donax TaxID=35708 RepID=A0A0A9EJB2_ARUDO
MYCASYALPDYHA